MVALNIRNIKNEVLIYTWNPNWENFQYFSLDEKINAFRDYVLLSQKIFGEMCANKQTICLIVAPDLIFTPAGDESNSIHNHTYSWDAYLHFKNRMEEIQNELLPTAFVIAGAIEYATEDNQHYKITSFILTKEQIQSYDKIEYIDDIITTKIENISRLKKSATLTALKNRKKNVFHFHGVIIGLEICQDHEKQTLLNAIKHAALDIHVLISAGQTARHDNVCAHVNKDVILVQCDRIPSYHSLSGVNTKSGVWQAKRLKISHTTTVQLTEIPMVEWPLRDALMKQSRVLLPQPSLTQINTRQPKRTQSHNLFNPPQPANAIDVNTLLNSILDITKDSDWSFLCAIANKPEGVSNIHDCLIKQGSQNLETLNVIKNIAAKSLDKHSLLRHGITTRFYLLVSNLNLDNINQSQMELHAIKRSVNSARKADYTNNISYAKTM